MLVTGSETTELAAAGALCLLEQSPGQKREALADPALGGPVFAESVRFDHPTDILCRVVRRDTEVCGRSLREGQGVLLLWGSANRDDQEYPDADRFDIHRRYERSLLFGHGQHKCIGEHLGLRMGTILLEELLGSVRHFEVDLAGTRRRRGEFLKGFTTVPLTFVRR